MENRLLIACDLDGTLLRGDKTISAYTLFTIKRCVQAGAIFAVNTGRFPENARAFFGDENLPLPVISTNGCVLSDDQQRVFASHPIDPGALQALLKVLEERHDLEINLFQHKHILSVGIPRPHHSFMQFGSLMTERYGVRYSVLSLPLSEAALQQPVYKVYLASFNGSQDREDVMRRLSCIDHLQVTSSGPDNAEVMPFGYNKGTGLMEMAKQLSVPLKNTIAIGDQLNDLPAFHACGCAVAVTNAHPAVLRAARVRTLSNEKDGPAHFINQLLDRLSEQNV